MGQISDTVYAAKYVLHSGPPKSCRREQPHLLIALLYADVHGGAALVQRVHHTGEALRGAACV